MYVTYKINVSKKKKCLRSFCRHVILLKQDDRLFEEKKRLLKRNFRLINLLLKLSRKPKHLIHAKQVVMQAECEKQVEQRQKNLCVKRQLRHFISFMFPLCLFHY